MHDISHDRDARRFSVRVDGQEGELDYTLEGGTMTITHTGVPEQLAGKGVGSALAEAAFQAARAEGWRVRPRCSFAAGWVERHPQYADLLA